MKKINNLLKEENAELKINKFCLLYRYKKDALGRKVDVLKLNVSIITSCDASFEIKSRDSKGIIEEIKKCQNEAFQKISEKLNKGLENGHLSR